jgi:hypothetical protein
MLKILPERYDYAEDTVQPARYEHVKDKDISCEVISMLQILPAR